MLLIGMDLISKHNIVIDVAKAMIMIGSLKIALKEANPGNLAKAKEDDRQARLVWIHKIRANKLGAPAKAPC